MTSSEHPEPAQAGNTVRSYQLDDPAPAIVSVVEQETTTTVLHPSGSDGWLPVEEETSTKGTSAPIPPEPKLVTRKVPPPVDTGNGTAAAAEADLVQPVLGPQAPVTPDVTAAPNATTSAGDGVLPQTAAERLRPATMTVGETEPARKTVSPVSRSASRRSAFTDSEGRRLSGGAFIGGAGMTGPGASAEPDIATTERHAQAHANLTPRQRSKVMKTEEQQNRRLSKIIKNEGKTERQALDLAIDELAELQRMQKNAVKAEIKSKANHSKLLTQLKKLEDSYIAAKLKYETFLGQVNAEEAALEALRTNARDITDRMQDKAAEVDTLRTTFAIDEREREIKLAQLKGKSGTPTGPLSAQTSTSQN